MAELQMKLLCGDTPGAHCRAPCAPPLPCLGLWGSQHCAGGAAGSSLVLVGHTGKGLWVLSPTSPGLSWGRELLPALQQQRGLPECPPEPFTRWGSPQALLAPGGGHGCPLMGLSLSLSCQWRTQHTVSSPTCGTSSSGQCPVPRASGHQVASRERGQPLKQLLLCSAAPSLHPFTPPSLPSLPALCRSEGWPHSVG